MTDFWVSSGHHLLDRAEGGGLVATDEFLKAYLARPELVPPPEACAAERNLWARLRIAPRDPVEPAEIAALADPDARENWAFMIGFRDRLIAGPTLEAAYRRLVLSRSAGGVPPLFLDQLVHVILRNALDGETDPFVLRAAEMFFRPQRVTLHEGMLLVADEERVDGAVRDHASPLVAMFGEARARELDVMTEDNAAHWFHHSDAFDLVQDFRPGGPARRGLARAMEIWVRHMLALEVRIEPVERIEDEAWAWFVGLDQEATRIGNALWNGAELAPQDAERVVALFRMDIPGDTRILPKVVGRPVWLILAADGARILRMKPQNLITGLPLTAEADPN